MRTSCHRSRSRSSNKRGRWRLRDSNARLEHCRSCCRNRPFPGSTSTRPSTWSNSSCSPYPWSRWSSPRCSSRSSLTSCPSPLRSLFRCQYRRSSRGLRLRLSFRPSPTWCPWPCLCRWCYSPWPFVPFAALQPSKKDPHPRPIGGRSHTCLRRKESPSANRRRVELGAKCRACAIRFLAEILRPRRLSPRKPGRAAQKCLSTRRARESEVRPRNASPKTPGEACSSMPPGASEREKSLHGARRRSSIANTTNAPQATVKMSVRAMSQRKPLIWTTA